MSENELTVVASEETHLVVDVSPGGFVAEFIFNPEKKGDAEVVFKSTSPGQETQCSQRIHARSLKAALDKFLDIYPFAFETQ